MSELQRITWPVGANETTPPRCDANGNLLVASGGSGLVSASIGYGGPFVSLTRKNDTTGYTANDVVGPESGTSAIEFANMGPSGGRILIERTQLRIDASAIISGETSYNLWLFGITPPSALADNAAFDIASGDRASLLGKLPLGTPVDEGSTLYVEQTLSGYQIKLTGTSLFAYLVTVGAYTPTAQRVYNVALHAAAL